MHYCHIHSLSETTSDCNFFSKLCFQNNIDGTCKCKANFYMDNMQKECIECPEFANCSQAGSSFNTLQPLTNHFQVQANPPLFLPCPYDGVCTQLGPDGIEQCIQGYEGPLCLKCSEQHSRQGMYECQRCPESSTANAVLLAVGLVGFVVLSTVYGWYSMFHLELSFVAYVSVCVCLCVLIICEYLCMCLM